MFSALSPYVALIASLCGLWVAIHINRKKRAKKKMVCPLRANCDKVVHSTHARTLGIPNELLGSGYYLLVSSFYALVLIFPEVFAVSGVYYLLFLLTLAGVIFSLYLVALQAIVIKAWCSWCMVSALASMVLGACLFAMPIEGVISLADAHRPWWIIAHSIGFILGVGAATITDVFFFRFLKDYRISGQEKATLETLTAVIWSGLAVLIVSGLMLFLPEQARLSDSPKFLVKVVVIGVITVNGFALNLFVSPRMRRLSFDGAAPARRLRRLAFALGGISIVSWYSAFILGSLRSIGSYSFSNGVLGYAVLLGVVVIGSQFFERKMMRAYRAHTENAET